MRDSSSESNTPIPAVMDGAVGGGPAPGTPSVFAAPNMVFGNLRGVKRPRTDADVVMVIQQQQAMLAIANGSTAEVAGEDVEVDGEDFQLALGNALELELSDDE